MANTLLQLLNGGTGASLSDPGADRLWFWDDSAGQITWLALGTNLSITGTTLNAVGGAPGGSDTELQYNNASAFDGISGFTTNGTDIIGTGLLNISGGSLRIPVAAAPTITTDGHLAFDTTVTDFSTGLLKFYGSEEQGIVSMPIAQFTSPTNGHVVTYDSTNDEFKLAAAGGGITIGTTTITSGTDTRALFNNAGVVGESSLLTVNTGTGTVNMASGYSNGGGMYHYGFYSRNGASYLYLDGGSWVGYDSYAIASFGLGAVNSSNKYFWQRYGLQYAVANLNASTLTLTLSHNVVTVQYTATGAVTITLPSAANAFHATYLTGHRYVILDTGVTAGTNNITINRAGSDTIITTTTGNTSVVGNTNGCRIEIQCIDATTWKANITA